MRIERKNNREQTIMERKHMTGVILAGGEGKRLGRDKTELVIDSESLIETIIAKLSTLFEELLMITSKRKYTHYAHRFAHLKVKIHTDIFNIRGSIAGVHSGLHHASHQHSFFVGCDMPFLNLSLIDYFTQIAEGNDVVVAQCASGFEPLHAIYSKRCMSYLEKLMQSNNLRIYDFYDEVKLHIVREDETERYDPGKLSFFNINTKQALYEALIIQESLTDRERYAI
jgi:molybdopterin-guanine dinucleotide biosynthesis protein A